MKTAEEETRGFQRARLREDLDKCTSRQTAFFARIYPDGVPDGELVTAWALVKRTLAANAAEDNTAQATKETP
jgi:hypothetical protein